MARRKTKSKKATPTNLATNKDAPVERTTTLRVSEQRLVVMALVLLSVGTTGFYYLPGLLQEDAPGSRLVNSFYCTVMTLTT